MVKTAPRYKSLWAGVAALVVVMGARAYLGREAQPPATGVDEEHAIRFENKRQRLAVAGAELAKSQEAMDLAFRRRDNIVAANKQYTMTVFAFDEVREAELVCKHYATVVAARRAAFDLARLELRASDHVLEILRQKVTLAQAELDAAVAAKEEAFFRWEKLVEPQRNLRAAGSVHEAKVVCDHCIQEEHKLREAFYQAHAALNAYANSGN
jgi:hypothetical protein